MGILVDGVWKDEWYDTKSGHYYTSHKAINPNGIVPIGPELDFSAPHGRGVRRTI